MSVSVRVRAAFVGLGIMGQAMALNLLRKPGGPEVELAVYNRTPARAEPLRAAGARVAASPREAAEGAEFVFTMVSDDAALRAVATGPEGFLAGVAAGSVIVDHSTVSRALTLELAREAAARGAAWCDAPVTGGDVGAREGSLTIMVGGPQEAFRRALPLLEKTGRRILHVGATGQGQALKAVSNMVSCLTLMASAEGIQLGLRAGLSLEALAEVMQHGSAASYELDKMLARFAREGYRPGFSVANRFKDLELALALARELGQPVPLASAAEPPYRSWREAHGELDESSYILALGADHPRPQE
ncbi:MAG: NAD(P)-dependent oxidoreductase [Bacillota bacterium]|nr:NAD(P)-dependent oxidoreductase [Bacillota bacterium]